MDRRPNSQLPVPTEAHPDSGPLAGGTIVILSGEEFAAFGRAVDNFEDCPEVDVQAQQEALLASVDAALSIDAAMLSSTEEPRNLSGLVPVSGLRATACFARSTLACSFGDAGIVAATVGNATDFAPDLVADGSLAAAAVVVQCDPSPAMRTNRLPSGVLVHVGGLEQRGNHVWTQGTEFFYRYAWDVDGVEPAVA